jgi:hypothetical protein
MSDFNTIDHSALETITGGGNDPVTTPQTPDQICGPNGVKTVKQSGVAVTLPGPIPNFDIGPIHADNGQIRWGSQEVECYPPK